MTVTSTANKISYAGNGVTTAFSFPYYFLLQADLLVTLTNNSTGVITTKVITTDYTISGTQASNGSYPSGGTVTMLAAPASGLTLTITRIPTDTQGTHWVDGDPDPALVKETAFDKLTLLMQRAMDLLSRSVRLPDGFTATFDPSLPTLMTANYGLAVNPSGNGWVLAQFASANSGTVTSVGVSAPAEFSVAGSPITSSGSITLSWATQSPNRIFAGPSGGGSATPGFRALVAADIPQSTLTPASMSSGAATNGKVATADGAGGITWSSIAGSGTVTSVALALPNIFSVSGSPVTGTGTLTAVLQSQNQNLVFASPNGSSGTPSFRALVPADYPVMTGASGGGNGTAGAVPAPALGQQGLFLRGDGSWASLSAGTVTSVAISVPAEFSVAGSPITTSGTFAITKVNQSANTFYAGPTNGAAASPAFRTILPADVPIYVGATGGSSGTAGLVPAANSGDQFKFLLGNGTWATSGAGSGTVTSVALTMPADFAVGGTPVTTSGTLAVTWATQNANRIFAGPSSGGAATPTWRALVGADLPNPAAATLGGVQSIAAVAHKWINTISTSGVPNLTQPDFTDITGTVTAAQLPAPTVGTLGGVFAIASVSHKWIDSIGPTGLPTLSQPAFTDISGTASNAQMPTPTTGALGGIQAINAVSHQWISSISTAGVPALTQPAFTDISGSVTAAQLPNPTTSALGGVQAINAVASNWIRSISTSGVPALSQPAFTDISGTLAATAGGTGLTTYTTGDILYSSASNVLSKLGIGATGKVLTVVAGIPAWAAPSGGGGGSLVWFTDGPNAPSVTSEFNRVVHGFDPTLGQSEYTSIKVPTTYTAGNPIKIKATFYSPSTSGNFLFSTIATLIRKNNDAVDSSTNQFSSTNTALTNTVAKQDREVGFDLTDGSGLINGVAVSAGDSIAIALLRGTDTDTDTVRFVPSEIEVLYS